MTQDSNLNVRMKHLEEQIGGLAEDVNELKELVNNFLEEMGVVQANIAALRVDIASTNLRAMANAITAYLRQRVDKQTIDSVVFSSCKEYLTRRYAVALAELPNASDPRLREKAFNDEITKFLAKKGIQPFIEL